MIRCLVKLYGLPGKVTELKSTEILLEDHARFSSILAALKREIPSLEGEVIRPGENRLTDYYAMNINGRFYTDFTIKGDTELAIKNDDHITVMPLSSGG